MLIAKTPILVRFEERDILRLLIQIICLVKKEKSTQSLIYQ